jgi:hypothetical protein
MPQSKMHLVVGRVTAVEHRLTSPLAVIRLFVDRGRSI